MEAFLQNRGSQALINPIYLDLRELLQTPSKSQRPERRKRDPSSTGSSAEKPPRKESRMAGGVAAEVDRIEQSQGDPNTVRMQDVEEHPRLDRQDATNGKSTQGNDSQGENFVRTFCKMTKEKRD